MPVRPAMARNRVLLPEPDGPRSTKNSPSPTSIETSLTTGWSWYRLVTWSSAMDMGPGSQKEPPRMLPAGGSAPGNPVVTMRSQTVLRHGTKRRRSRTNEYTFSPVARPFSGARCLMATENNPIYAVEKTTAERRERPHWVLDDAVYSIAALLLSVILIHSFWTLIIRPRAEAVLSQRVAVTNSTGVKAQVLQLRSVYVILKDNEQEICVILCMWSLL